MLKARDMMNQEPPYCMPDTPVRTLAERFADEQVSGLLVVDEEKRLLGVVTEQDLIDQQAQLHLPTAMAVFDMVIPLGEQRFEAELARMQAVEAKDLMSTNVCTVDVDADLPDIATLMAEKDIHHLPVLENDAVVGLISRNEVMKALAGKLFAK